MVINLNKEKHLKVYINGRLLPQVISASIEMVSDNVKSYKSNMNEILQGEVWEGLTTSKVNYIKIIQNVVDLSQITDLNFSLSVYVGETNKQFENCYIKDFQIKFDDEGKLVKISTICGEGV